MRKTLREDGPAGHQARPGVASELQFGRRQVAGGRRQIVELLLHRVLVGAYNLQQFTWTRFCATGTLSDYRPHSRYHLSSF